MTKWLAVLVASVALMVTALALAGPANAGEYTRLGTFSGPGAGSGDGELARPRRVATENSTGNVFVADSANNRVEVFRPEGDTAVYLTQFPVASPYGIAIDQDTGSVYVTDATNNVIHLFDTDGAATPTFTEDGSFTSPVQGGGDGEIANFDVGIGFDQGADELVVADRDNDRVSRYTAAGAYVPNSSFNGTLSVGGTFNNLLDIAVDSTGDVLVVDATGTLEDVINGNAGTRVERFSSTGEPEGQVGPSPCTGVEGHGGNASPPFPSCSGTVSVDAENDDVLVGANFYSYFGFLPPRVDVFSKSGAAVAQISLPGTDDGIGAPETVWGVIGGVAAPAGSNRLYVVTDTDPFESKYGEVSGQVYRIPRPAPPEATTGTAAQLATTTAKLRGSVDANNLATRFWFEYGLTGAYGTSIPIAHNADAGSANDSVEVGRSINGLEPATTYHFRLVAENSLGTSVGADQTFSTGSEASGPSGASTAWYQMVSPTDKGGGDILSGPWNTKSSLSGDRVVFWTKNVSFGDAPVAIDPLVYIGTLGADGWTTHALSPPWTPSSNKAIKPYFQAFSPDLTKSAFFTSNPPLVPGAQEDTGNLYVRDDTATSSPYTLLTPSGPPHATDDDYEAAVAGASSDYRRVIFESPWPMTPDAPDGVRSNLYEWADGTLTLAGVLPDGDPAQGSYAGHDVHRGVNGIPPGVRGDSYADGAISRDGSRVFFTEDATTQIYMRESGTTTWVSAPHLDPDHPASHPEMPTGVSEPAQFLAATPDGSKAFFSSTAELTPAPLPHSGSRLYSYDAATDTLTDLTAPGDVGDLQGLVGASQDGRTVYFVSAEQVGTDVVKTLYMARDGATHSIKMLSSDDGLNISDGCMWVQDVSGCGEEKSARVSPDGDSLVFSWSRQLTPYDTAGTRQIYRYRASQDELTCVSCSARLQQSTDEARLTSTGGQLYLGFHTTPLVSDGRVFFETRQALVAADTNNRIDVYVRDGDDLRLVTTGGGDKDFRIADVDLAGDRVFFTTGQQIATQDRDDNVDLYVARFDERPPDPGPPAKPCSGDECQGGRTAVPTAPGADTAAFRGPGNAPAAKKKSSMTVSTPKAVAGRAVRVKVRVSAPGSISISGSSVRDARRSAGKAATYTVKVSLTAKARAALRDRRSLRTKLTVTFKPKAGSSATKTVSLTFKQPKAKKRPTRVTSDRATTPTGRSSR